MSASPTVTSAPETREARVPQGSNHGMLQAGCGMDAQTAGQPHPIPTKSAQPKVLVRLANEETQRSGLSLQILCPSGRLIFASPSFTVSAGFGTDGRWHCIFAAFSFARPRIGPCEKEDGHFFRHGR